eukprot:CAMPEP_0177645250 /NCGR_PEP_ID=MMETSP0447-20121125/9149_1 /TAXON_ID=0 /ORGANISM="Stygamoeba regulata, Strain BSH-02190019" /LENGTH=308 /DNA_ID=CAMNT_0019147721 /DNA_START=15 /DNA_END=941 /DNA_ORIENTATION=+
MADAAPSVLPGSTDNEKLDALCKLPYKQQAVWFLNAYWEKCKDNAEIFWKYVEKFVEIDIDHRELGCAVDELCAHRFLEAFQETLTVRAMRTELRKSGAIGDRVKNIPLTHYLIFSRQIDWHRLVNASQGDNAEQIAQAQAMLDAVSRAFEDCKAREEEAKASEAAAKAAQAELEAALADLHAQEEAYNNKTADLKKKSEEGGVVSRNRAKVQLDAHLAEDPLPLRRAKLTTEAATKKAAKATAAAEAAREAAEAAVVDAQNKVAEAEAYLEELKMQGGSGEGSIWWMERELFEKKKYMPTSKGGVHK